MFKSIIQSILERKVKRYFSAHPNIKLVVVTGSVGKTTTKLAIARALVERYRVRVHAGNYNSELSAPLAIMGVNYPENIRSLAEWVRVYKDVNKRIKEEDSVDIIVQELGTDRVGQIPHFGTYLNPDIAVVSAISPEHMEFFKTMDLVANEELAVASYSKQVLVNGDDIDPMYIGHIKNDLVDKYGLAQTNDYYFVQTDFSVENGYIGTIESNEFSQNINVRLPVLGRHIVKACVVAAAIAIKFGVSPDEISHALESFNRVPGRMNVLKGKNNSIIIDDTYNSSPLAMQAALNTLYELPASKKIAVIGDMNELGESAESAHNLIGSMCNPDQLDYVVTVGKLTEQYLASAALIKGCKVKSFSTAEEAGDFVLNMIKPETIVLLKGSQGGIYLEEAVKKLLANKKDIDNLVRQSKYWLARKKTK